MTQQASKSSPPQAERSEAVRVAVQTLGGSLSREMGCCGLLGWPPGGRPTPHLCMDPSLPPVRPPAPPPVLHHHRSPPGPPPRAPSPRISPISPNFNIQSNTLPLGTAGTGYLGIVLIRPVLLGILELIDRWKICLMG